MEPWQQVVLTVFTSVLASSGLWAVVMKSMDNKDAKTKMLIGLGHDRIVTLGLTYIERGYITQDEFENLNKYLYEPYKKLGGNGSAEKIMQEVIKLPTRKSRIDVDEGV